MLDRRLSCLYVFMCLSLCPLVSSQLYAHPKRMRSKFEVVRSRPKFCTFCPPTFWGGSPKFWAPDYHAEEPSDHVAKFRCDRPAELGDLVAKKTSAVKHKPAGNYRCGRPNSANKKLNNCVDIKTHRSGDWSALISVDLTLFSRFVTLL